jgi:hypothetical protein
MKKAAPEIQMGRQQVRLCTVLMAQGQGVSLAAKSGRADSDRTKTGAD